MRRACNIQTSHRGISCSRLRTLSLFVTSFSIMSKEGKNPLRNLVADKVWPSVKDHLSQHHDGHFPPKPFNTKLTIFCWFDELCTEGNIVCDNLSADHLGHITATFTSSMGFASVLLVVSNTFIGPKVTVVKKRTKFTCLWTYAIFNFMPSLCSYGQIYIDNCLIVLQCYCHNEFM